MYTPDVSGGEEVVQVAGSPEVVQAALHAWLTAFLASSEPVQDGPGDRSMT